ncbi:hypothetical protein TomTYG75_05220 [Sphingobium sp. TomTYG75]
MINIGAPTPWPVLPPGIHDTDFQEIEAVFASTPHRQWLFDGFVRAADALAAAGCKIAYLDGSFVTGKPHPDDYDGCWDHSGVDLSLLDPVLKSFESKRLKQKRKYFGEMFPAISMAAPGLSFLQFFQIEKYSQRPKGILRVSLAAKGATP